MSLDTVEDTGRSNRRDVHGVSALERQVDIALALGCQSIWLHVSRQDELTLAAQHLVEKAGARFRQFSQGRQILGSLRKQDELLVLSEGLVIADDRAMAPLQNGAVLLRLPAKEGVQAGFEGLDSEYAWAGAMVLPGSIAEKLEQLADDIDPAPALLRAGRAARLPEADMEISLVTTGQWSLLGETPMPVRSDESNRPQASLLEHFVIEPLAQLFPGKREVRLVTGSFGVIATLAAAWLAYREFFPVALSLLAMAIFLGRLFAAQARARDPLVFSGGVKSPWAARILNLFDAVGLLTLCLALLGQYDVFAAIYMSFLTYALWRLGAVQASAASRLLRDRELLWATLAIGGGIGFWIGGIVLCTAVALGTVAAASIKASIKPTAITRA